MLGTNQNSGWLDLSEYVVHLTKGGQDEAYRAILTILSTGRLKRGPQAFGSARDVPDLADSQRVVCFSEIPLGFLKRLSERRNSCYGIGFTKRFLLDRGGVPVWYLEHGTAPQKAFARLIQQTKTAGIDPSQPLWSLTPFVDFPSGPNSRYHYDFRWEREWRTNSDVVFGVADVAFLLIPEDLHDSARTFFEDAVEQNTGPGYFCPYIDPTWPLNTVAEAMAAIASPEEKERWIRSRISDLADEAARLQSKDAPRGRCPACRSNDLEDVSFDYQGRAASFVVCRECGHQFGECI
jgi:hypothetical protein